MGVLIKILNNAMFGFVIIVGSKLDRFGLIKSIVSPIYISTCIGAYIGILQPGKLIILLLRYAF